ncbi:MAG: hypothetical protein WDO74_28015 [Pseudomonadota bacterium]
MGVLGVCLMALGALVASSANTKTAEAHSNPVMPLATSQVQALAPIVISAPANATVTPKVPVAAPVEIITPPPADLNLEDAKLRRMQKEEITPSMLETAAKIVRKHCAKPVGTQVEVDVDGKHVIARIERHFHPEGGPVKPWGFHPGVSLFVLR